MIIDSLDFSQRAFSYARHALILLSLWEIMKRSSEIVTEVHTLRKMDKQSFFGSPPMQPIDLATK